MAGFTLTFHTDSPAFRDGDFASEVAAALRRVADKVDKHSDTPLEETVDETGRVTDTARQIIGQWEYRA